jgi:hypothetical protein
LTVQGRFGNICLVSGPTPDGLGDHVVILRSARSDCPESEFAPRHALAM